MKKALILTILLAVMLPLLVSGSPASAQEAAPVAQATDAASLFRAAYEAVNAGDLDTFVTYFAEDGVSMALPPPPSVENVVIGRERLRSVHASLVERNWHVEFTSFQTQGDVATFTAQVEEDLFRDLNILPMEFSGTVAAQDGLIRSAVWVMSKDSLARLEAAIARMESRALVERLYEKVFNQKNLDVVDEIYASDVTDHDFGDTDREAVKAGIAGVLVGLPDLEVTTDLWLVDGDLVTTRVTFSGTHQGEWLDVPPSGNTVTWTHIDIHRIEDGRITDIWHTVPVGDILQQMGFELVSSAE